jgi:hypothetical protein
VIGTKRSLCRRFQARNRLGYCAGEVRLKILSTTLQTWRRRSSFYVQISLRRNGDSYPVEGENGASN